MPKYINVDQNHSTTTTCIILTAILLINSIIDIGRKLLIDKIGSPVKVVTQRAILQAFLLFIWISYFGHIEINFQAWFLTSSNLGNAFLVFLSSIFHLRAIKYAPISAVLPYLSEGTAWLLVSSCIWFNDTLEWQSIFGFILTILGHIVMNLSQLDENSAKVSIKTILIPEKPGARLMMVSAILWSISAALDKPGREHHHPLVHAFLTQVVVALYGISYEYLKQKSGDLIDPEIKDTFEGKAKYSGRKLNLQDYSEVKGTEFPAEKRISKKTFFILLITSLLAFSSYSLYGFALRGEYYGYIPATKRSSILVSLLVDKFIFQGHRESKNFKEYNSKVWLLQFAGCLFLCTSTFLFLI